MKMNCLSGNSKKCLWIINRTRFFTTSWLTLALRDRKSTRLNSSHVAISYAVFCLKKNVMPDIMEWPSADGIRRDITLNLEVSGIRFRLARRNAPGPRGQPGWPHPTTAYGDDNRG